MSTKPKRIAPAPYPEYILNFIMGDDPGAKIPTFAAKPTGPKATDEAIAAAAKALVDREGSKHVHVTPIHGSHTLAMESAGRKIDVFISHQNEDKDALPTINVVFRPR